LPAIRLAIERDALTDQIRVERSRAQHVLVAVALLHGGGALARMFDAWKVACSADGDRRILRQLAVDPVRSVDLGDVGG
jgi:hypothetical protein